MEGVRPSSAAAPLGLVPLARLDELRPVARPQLADRGGVGGQARGLEQVLAVADGHRADVGAEADRSAVGGGGLVPLPRQVVLLVDTGGVGQVGEGVGEVLGGGQGYAADFEGLHVVEASAREPGLQGGPVVALDGRRVLLDGDPGMLLHVRVVQTGLLVPEGSEGADGQGDLPVGGGGPGAGGRAAGEGEREGHGRGGEDGGAGADTRHGRAGHGISSMRQRGCGGRCGSRRPSKAGARTRPRGLFPELGALPKDGIETLPSL